jgi:hypothetical protein
MRSVTKITINPSPKTVELITIVSTQREVTEDNTTSIYVFSTTDKKKAWEHLKDDIKNECSDHCWAQIKVRLKDIEEGKYFSSPESDPDHEYVWKVNIQTITV